VDYRENPTLVIPKLGVIAPVVKEVSLTDASLYKASLLEGVALAEDGAGLEEMGNTVLFGHSSSSEGGAYATVFLRLSDLVQGDEVLVRVADRGYKYRVSKSLAIESSQVTVVQQTQERKLTLFTCWPPGTTVKRWMVIAEPV
jgi:sortase A